MQVEVDAELSKNEKRKHTCFYLIGGGIASMSAAAFLIRDGAILGHNITILEEMDRLGGSLDGSGSAKYCYVVRGGRMLESKYVCTYDLFSSIPTLDGTKNVTQEIFDWNHVLETSSHSRLVRNAQPINAPAFNLSEKHILALERLMIESEQMLWDATIQVQFDDDFFRTNFWLMWCTTFAFQPWHSAVEFKRYLLRFSHMVPGFNQLHGIMRTVYNQFDSMVRPLHQWLLARGVKFQLNTTVQDLVLKSEDGESGLVEKILFIQDQTPGEISVGLNDFVIVTLGSMTAASSLGGNDTIAAIKGKKDGGAWLLWEKIAQGRPEFGRPGAFSDHIEESKWMSSTTTLSDPAFFQFMLDFTGNIAGEGGLITLADSPWLMSLVLPFQPHFIDQPDGVNVFWAYGLHLDRHGHFVKKLMPDCTGREIFSEMLGHLGVNGDDQEHILNTSITIPCLMPFITSQFLRREPADRPAIVPAGWKNLAFTGQFCEQPDDVVFTVEYSIRSSATAVYSLLGLNRKPPSIYKGQLDPRVLFKGLAALHQHV
jgi:oleate hydratase